MYWFHNDELIYIFFIYFFFERVKKDIFVKDQFDNKLILVDTLEV